MVARRYAKALYEQTGAQPDGRGATDAVHAGVALIRESLNGSRDLRRFFESPVIPAEKKESIIDELFADRVSELMLRFMKLLLRKKREDVLPDILAAYSALRDEQLGIVEAHARAAQEMDEGAKQSLREALQRMTGKDVRLNVRTDASLLGGLVVRIGDRVYDGSVEHQLAALRERMERGRAVVNGEAA